MVQGIRKVPAREGMSREERCKTSRNVAVLVTERGKLASELRLIGGACQAGTHNRLQAGKELLGGHQDIN